MQLVDLLIQLRQRTRIVDNDIRQFQPLFPGQLRRHYPPDLVLAVGIPRAGAQYLHGLGNVYHHDAIDQLLLLAFQQQR